MSFLTELKRRNVFKVAAAYVIVGWLILQVGEVLSPALLLPDWINSALAFFIILGFPLALFFAWAFELTPEGLKKEKDVDRSQSITAQTGQKLNVTIIALLTLALAYFVADRFWFHRQPASVVPAPAQQPDRAGAEAGDGLAAEELSIAVLPFVNMSSDPEQEFFSDGLSEELLNLLSKIPELKVTSRSSAFSFKGQAIDIPTVAQRLQVAHILEGSVRKAGNRVRITAQLIHAADDVHLWSETYDRELDDVFAIQDEIAGQVVEALQLKLLGRDLVSTATDTGAYETFLRGRHFQSMGDSYNEEAERAFREALVIDPDYAPAWAGLSVVLRDQANRGAIDLHDGTRQARAAAVRALEIDPELPEAWSALAHIEFHYDWDWDRALGTVRTALQYAPNNIEALLVLAQMLEGLGRVDEAIEAAEKAVSLDPLNRQSSRRLALVQWAAGRYAEAEATTRRLWALHPESDNAPMLLGLLLNLQGKPEEGLSYVEQGGDEFWRTFALALVYHSLGRRDDSDRALEHLMDEFGYFGAFQVAVVYAWRGQMDEAFKWLDISYEQRDGGFNTILVDPSFRSLYDDPRWEPLLNRIGLLPYWRAMQTAPEEARS